MGKSESVENLPVSTPKNVALLLPLRHKGRVFTTRHHLINLIKGLEKSIEEKPDPRYVELAVLKDAYARLDGDGPMAGANPGFGARLREGSKKERFRLAVNDLINKHGGRVHRQEIMAYAANVGMFGPQATKKSLDRDVSKYLSNDGTFASDGDGYWRRKADPPATKRGLDV